MACLCSCQSRVKVSASLANVGSLAVGAFDLTNCSESDIVYRLFSMQILSEYAVYTTAIKNLSIWSLEQGTLMQSITQLQIMSSTLQHKLQ